MYPSILLPPPPSIGILFCADDAKPQGNKAKSRMHSDGFKRLSSVSLKLTTIFILSLFQVSVE